MKPKVLFGAIVVLGGLALAGGGLGFWKYRSVQAANAAQQPIEPATVISILSARSAKWRPTAELVGTVIALQSITVSNEVAGTIKQVRFESGSIVEPGDVLLTMDASTEEADLRAAQASVAVAQAELRTADVRLRLAETNLKRMTQAMESRAVSDVDLDNAKGELDRSAAERDRAKSVIDQSAAREAQVRSILDKKTIRAPFKARAGLRNVHDGQYLAEGTSVVSLQGIADTIFLDFAIPQDEAARAKPGTTVLARGAAFGDEPVEIKVVALDASVNPNTRNVRIRGELDNHGERLRPGMFVEIKVPIGDEREFVVVPGIAVRRSSFGDQVYVIVPGEKPDQLRVQQRFVKLGPALGSDQVILDGVVAGERVAGPGAFKLRDKALVTEAPPAAPAPAEPGAEAPSASKH